MLKAELQKLVEEQEDTISRLQNDVGYWKDSSDSAEACITKMEKDFEATMFGYGKAINNMTLQQEDELKEALSKIFN